jgi:hypothetical protein
VSQSRRHSLIEAWANVLVGYTVSMVANFAFFPMFGWHISLHQNLLLGGLFTVVSLVRSYCLRRAFNRWHS